MILQVVVVVLACIAASLLAITIASLTLSFIGRLLSRAGETGDDR
ncbi:MAG TPA: hypothetical protein VFQ92_13365 [Blastocatellia bacterium]|nr:hypothetical protein [Blastocatellia bacterium]